MNCTFFGHRDVGEEIKVLLKKTIIYLYERGEVKRFLVGNNGNFDFYVQIVLSELKSERNLDFDIVLSYVDEAALSKKWEETIFLEELEGVIPRYAIARRNDWLIKNSSIVVAYVKHKFSNSSKWIEKARKKGLRIINIADESSIF